jgi:hypothetical protein
MDMGIALFILDFRNNWFLVNLFRNKMKNQIIEYEKENIKHITLNNEIITKDDKYKYEWYLPNRNIRGHKFTKVFIDEDIEDEEILELIFELCCVFCCDEDIYLI